jgi:hypothetical protein
MSAVRNGESHRPRPVCPRVDTGWRRKHGAPGAAILTRGRSQPVVSQGTTVNYRVGVASDAAVVPHSAHVEILATGPPGRRFALSWEETCGWTREGQAAVGGTGGQGTAVLRTPVVTFVNLPRIHRGVASCYLAATAAATSFTRRLRLAIIDY